MSELLTRYLQRQILSGVTVMKSKTVNAQGVKFPTRTIIVKLRMYTENFLSNVPGSRRWVVLPGLRGVGKTTVLAQLYLELNDKYGDGLNMLYVSMDEVVEKIGSNLSELIDEYERLLPDGSFEATKKPTILFIDEVQVDASWARILKFLYDRVPNVFIICSGSSATHLQLDADVSGRRAVIEKLYPLSFPEYQVLANEAYPPRGLKQGLIDALYGSDTAQEVHDKLVKLKPLVDRAWTQYPRSSVEKYLDTGTIPFTLLEKDPQQVYSAISAMTDKIISLDMQSLQQFNSETIGAMKRLVMILSDCDVMPLAKMADTVGVSRPQLINILDAFVKAELFIKVPAHGNNVVASTNPSKFFFMSPAIRAAFHDIVGVPGTKESRRGALLEDVAALHYYREFVTKRQGSVTHPYDKSGGQCDFILRVGNVRQIPIEFGYGQKDFTQTEATLSKSGGNYGLVFSQSGLSINKEKTIVKVPLDFFFMM